MATSWAWRCFRAALQVGAGSPAPASAPLPAGGVGGSSEGLALFSLVAGAGAAGADGAGAALLNSSPLLKRLRLAGEVAPPATSKQL